MISTVQYQRGGICCHNNRTRCEVCEELYQMFCELHPDNRSCKCSASIHWNQQFKALGRKHQLASVIPHEEVAQDG